MEKEYYLTKQKKKELEEELDFLKNTRRKEIAETLEHARSLGDLSENAEYQEARSDQASIEGRIREIENILKSAKIVSHKKGDTVEIGSNVIVRKAHHSKTQEYEIVGSEEADMTQGRISYTSPLGSALMGKKKGESFEFATPAGTMKYTVEDVE